MDSLVERLRAGETARIVTLPDGSVDRRMGVLDEDGTAVSRAALGERILAGEKSFLTRERAVDPGGMAVNAAKQTHALGDRTTLFGHLDHEVFADLEMQTVSMGVPADVTVYELSDAAVMFTDESPDIASWRFETLQAATKGRFEYALSADGVVATNWASVPYMTGVFADLAATDLDGGWLVVDPGDVTMREYEDVTTFVDVLGDLEGNYDVVISANQEELEHVAEAVGASGDSAVDLLAEIRGATDLSAVVLHEKPRAVAATRDGTHVVENFETPTPVRFAGGGDRFSGGLAHALAVGWPWPAALGLANACASYYVEHGETGSQADLLDFAEESLG